MKPLVKWVGCKTWQADTLRPHVSGRRVVELFAGSAAITCALEPQRALINDINPHLINLYRHVQAGTMEWEHEQTNEDEYYERRTRFNDMIAEGAGDTVLAAQLFYYLLTHGFNNLCRFNKDGRFNVPYRPRGTRAPDMTGASWPATWELQAGPWYAVQFELGDFIYADPPYDNTFVEYSSEGWSRKKFEELVESLTHVPNPIVIMNSESQYTREVFRDLGYNVTSLDSHQKMHASRGRTDTVRELMATRNV